MKLFGVDFAPLNIPLRRRLQTSSAVFYVFCGILLGPATSILFIYTLFFTSYYWLALLYVLYRYVDGHPQTTGGIHEGWSYSFIRRFPVWKNFGEYFPVQLIKTTELNPKKNYILAFFPHGFVCVGGTLCFGTDALNVAAVFPGIRIKLIVVDLVFRLPGMRELFLWGGACASSKESLKCVLGDPEGGVGAMLVVGGAAEALLSRPGDMKVVLKKRTGFVKMALESGASLVPVISFGENDLYDQVSNPEGSWLRDLQERMKKLTGISPPLVNGRGVFQYTFGLLPRRRPISVVVGKPIDVDKVVDPSLTQITALHERFVTDLTELFEENKHKYLEGADNISLIIE